MLQSWKNIDARVAAGTLTRAAWKAHTARAYEWERHMTVGSAQRRLYANKQASRYLPEAGRIARREPVH